MCVRKSLVKLCTRHNGRYGDPIITDERWCKEAKKSGRFGRCSKGIKADEVIIPERCPNCVLAYGAERVG